MKSDHLDDDYDDYDGTFGETSTSESHPVLLEEEESRDEEEEIRKGSAKETARVKTWRFLVTLALLATAVSVTATTYSLLVKQEDEKFRNVYAQFARTVADAAIDQQKNLRAALRSLSDTISVSANLQTQGKPTWPYYFPPMFEIYAHDFFEISAAEFIGISNIVKHAQRDSFVNYSTMVYQQAVIDAHIIRYGGLDKLDNDTGKYRPYIGQKLSNGTFTVDYERDLYLVRTIQSPPVDKYGPMINVNIAADKGVRASLESILTLRNETTFSKIRPFVALPAEAHKGYHSDDNADNPHCFAFFPIYQFPDDTSDIVATMSAAIAFDASMRNLLPENVKGMLCVVENNCGQTVSYRIDGHDAFYKGEGDLHNPKYDELAIPVDLSLYQNADLPSTPGHCMYSMKIYPTQDFEDDYKTTTPVIFASVVAGTFVFVAIVFLMYDFMVLKRNELMISNAAKSNAVVSSFVPEHLRERLINQQAQKRRGGTLKTFLNDGTNGQQDGGAAAAASAPLADLFLETTVLFADISGFTAWSSVREPQQVFTLLETLYQAFDSIARKRRVFKVETVGDCYVAVCGIPDPRRDHAVIMARFAKDILVKMDVLTNELEVSLGPDTGLLALRIGMHSGPVTAGVLRGERARFQLFGDTMNTCSRMESSGKPNRIQCSKETAEQLIKLGKGAWVQKRSEHINLKGKGSCEAYWVMIHGDYAGSVSSGGESQSRAISTGISNDRTKRLIDWNVEMLTRLLKEIGARQAATAGGRSSTQQLCMNQLEMEYGNTPLEEVREIITLPEFDIKASNEQDPEDFEVPGEVLEQLHHLVNIIASMYRNNPFHNFDHASHVVMSVVKLMSRIIAPSQLEDLLDEKNKSAAASLHDHTYGITSDPLTQFACAFSALIHDVDHVGVSNAQLVKEEAPIAKKYKERSVAEQNSLDLSWNLLMKPEYKAFRAFLFPTQADLVRFRQLVVNSVMSTDIVDTDLKNLRNDRWDKAFKKKGCDDKDGSAAKKEQATNERDEVNRKATIVIEHIIQASDISHTMQHWHVYRKWNQNLFEELYVAYLNGRMEKDPAEFWYKGEIGFFDFYIIPLTKKLKECGVFGVSSGEFVNHAMNNRQEWMVRGEEMVAGMIEEVRMKYGDKEGQHQDGEIVATVQEEAPPRTTTTTTTSLPMLFETLTNICEV